MLLEGAVLAPWNVMLMSRSTLYVDVRLIASTSIAATFTGIDYLSASVPLVARRRQLLWSCVAPERSSVMFASDVHWWRLVVGFCTILL